MSKEKSGGFAAKLSGGVTAFANNRYIQVISRGMMGTLAITMVGSIFTIFAGLTFLPEAFRTVCTTATMVTSNLITVYVIMSLAIVMAKECKQDAIASVVLALACFFVLTPISVFEVGESKVSAIEISYLGSKGMFVGMIVAILATRLYAFLVDKRVTIRLPDSVPDMVSRSFEAIVPAFIVFALAMIVRLGFQYTGFGNIHDFIYKTLQLPLQGLGESIWSAILLLLLSEFLWFFGIHGSNVTSSIMTALFTTQAYANMEAVAAGQAPQFILNTFFLSAYKGPRHLALACILLFICRSDRFKAIGKIAVVPGVFGISEPMKFGIPMVMNPWILLPMSLSPVISMLIAYVATLVGFMPVVSVNVPWTVPPIISGFMTAGWQGAVVQIVQFVAVIFLYLPFIKKLDRDELKLEKTKKEGAAVAAAI